MSEIKKYITVDISRETARITQTGFGEALLFGPHYYFPDRVRAYSDPADMITDGFQTTDDLYIAALKHMGQTLSPPEFKVGRKLEDVTATASLVFTGTPSAGTWTLNVGIGAATPVTTANITYAADDDTALIKAAIEALAGITEVTVTGLYSTGYTITFTGVDDNTDFRVTAIDVSALTGVTAATVTMDQYGSAVETWDTGLNAILAADVDWYSLHATTKTKADILLLAAIIETQIKWYGVTTAEADVKNGVASNTLKELKALNYDRTWYEYSADAANFPEAAWSGGQLPKNPGSITWAFKPQTGITSDTLTTTEYNNIINDNGNLYETVGGQPMTFKGVVVSGEYMDIIRGTDWLQTRMSEDLFLLLINQDKVPMTERGAGMVEGKIKYWLERAESTDVNLLVPGSSIINVPKITDLSTADKLARFLSGITFSGTYQGAVHKIGVSGKLSV